MTSPELEAWFYRNGALNAPGRTSIPINFKLSGAIQVSRLSVVSAGIIPPPPPPPNVFTRPTGTGYTPIESLLLAGETMTGLQDPDLAPNLSTVMFRLTTASIITFPEGVFTVRDFNGNNSGVYAIMAPKICKGIWGSGPGNSWALDASGNPTADPADRTGTVFTMVPNSSTMSAKQPAQSTGQPTPFRVFYHSGLSSVSYGQFHIAGQPQQNLFHGFTSYASAGAHTAQDIFVSGSSGNNGAPPGETFSFEIHQPNGGRSDRILTDGRRSFGDASGFAAVGITVSNASNYELHHCTLQYVIASPLVYYQTNNCIDYDCKIGNTADTASSAFAGGINHERSTGTIHVRSNIQNNRTNGAVHSTHSNDAGSFSFNGTSWSVSDGTLTYVDPIWNTTMHTDGRLWVQTWHPYSAGAGGCTMTGNAVYSGNTITRKIGNMPRIYTGGVDVPGGVDLTGATDVSDAKLHYIHNFTGWNSVPNPTAHTTA